MIVHLVLDGTAESALGIALDVFDAARRLASDAKKKAFAQRVVSPDGKPVRAGNGRRVAVGGTFRTPSLRRGDVILLAGITATTPDAIAARLTRPDVTHVLPLLARAARRGVTIAASCSATFVLGDAGLLDGRSATTTWWLARAFASRFPQTTLASERMVVEDRAVLTAGAAFAHADLALALVRRLGGASMAHLVARYLVLEDGRVAQSRYMVLDHTRSDDPVVRRLERHIETHLDHGLSLHELARATATSERTLARRVEQALGTTPGKLVQRIRMTHASHLLATTREPVEAIARRVGYADAAAFRRILRAHTGKSPRELRAS